MRYCEEYAALLDLYVDGELSPQESARVLEHLDGCPGCRAYVEDALAIRAAFGELEEAQTPDGFAAGVMAAIRAEERRKAPACKSADWRRWKRVLLPLAACFAVVLLLRYGPLRTGNGGGAADTSAAPEAAPEGDVGYAVTFSGVSAGGAPAEAPQSLEPEADADVPMARITGGDPAAAVPAFDLEITENGEEQIILEIPAPGANITEGVSAGGEEEKIARRTERAIRLTASQAAELLEDVPYTDEGDGLRCYRLTDEEFNALLKVLAGRGVEPEEAEASAGSSDFSGGGLVYVAEEP